MDISFLAEYFDVIIVGICLCVGFVIKSIDVIPNKIIPLIMAILGLLLTVWEHSGAMTPATVLTGLFSGLASTGLYEAFANFIKKGDSE